MSKNEWIWMPHAGHFILGSECRFRLNTYVNGYIISTVGELVQREPVQRIHARIADGKWYADCMLLTGDWWAVAYQRRFGYDEIGLGRTYETMVFPAAPGDPAHTCCPWELATSESVDFAGYTDAGDAYRGHMAMCERWDAK